MVKSIFEIYAIDVELPTSGGLATGKKKPKKSPDNVEA
jgi:hypothetical protein